MRTKPATKTPWGRRFRLPGLLAVAILATAATPRTQAILDLANAAPPEFHAWAILKVVQAQLIKVPAAQRQLIEQAYQLGAAAHARYPMQALSGLPQNSLSAIRGLAGKLDLDALSLQTRAVQLMLPINKARARQMFVDIAKPSPAPLGCDDDLIPRLGDYYQILGRVAQETFTAKERQREDHVNFLLDYVAAISSPSQLVPVATMLRGLNLTPNQMQLLYARLGGALETITPDDRSFADVTGALTPLLTADLMPAFQRFIGNHAAAPRCQKPQDAVQPQVAMGDQSNSPAGDYKGEMLGSSPEAKRIRQMGFDLRIRDSRVLTAADRADAAWQQAFTAYLNALAQWPHAQGESDAAFLHERVAAWMAAADLATTPDSRAYAVGEAVRVMANSPVEDSSPAEWFLQAVQADPGRQLTEDLLRAYEGSGNPVLALYAALVRVAGPNIVQ